MSPARRRTDRPLAAREQLVVDAAITGTLSALGITDVTEFHGVLPRMSKWFVTMESKDAAALAASDARRAVWHRVWELISKIGFEESVRWIFRTVGVLATLAVAYLLGHWFAVSTGLLKLLLG